MSRLLVEPSVIVIGSGQAGVPLAVKLAGAGKSVVLAERARLGGTCVNSGCTPTKTLIASARAAHVARTSGRLGVRTGTVDVDFGVVRDRVDAIVENWRDGVRRRLDGAGDRLRVVSGQARFVGPHTVDVFGERFSADTIVIDVGARPRIPALEGLDSVPWLDSRRLLNLRQIPAHLVVLGGGYVGAEFAQAFRRFGAEVTVLDAADHLLGREDPDVSQELERVFAGEGVRLELGRKVRSVASHGSAVRARLDDGRDIEGSHLLVAVGRRPNTDDLGCDAAGIELDERGHVRVNERYETSVPGVYAVGDATGSPQFTHVAWDDHRILFDVLMGRPARARSSRFHPYAVFTDPEIAGVGLNERRARELDVPYELATLPFSAVARAREADEQAGLFKVLLDPKSERLLGASIVGAGAGELIHPFVVLMQARAGARAVVDAEFVHPTLSEGVQSVVMALERYSS